MASRKPLAEVRASVKSVHRSRAKAPAGGGTDISYARPGPYTVSWVVDPEDVAIVDAFLNGPMGGHQVVLRLLTLEQGWTAPKCDPNIEPEEAIMDDELSRLRAQHADLLAAMTGRGDETEPASDAPSA